MTTEEAIERVATDMAQRKNDSEWSLDVCRKMVELARPTIARNPQRFAELYFADIAIHEQNARRSS